MRRWIIVVAALGVFTHATNAAGQRPITFGVAGGVSVPEGDLRDGANTGWHALGTLMLSSLMQPLGLRLDVAYNRFDFTNRFQTDLGEDGFQTTTSATLNVTYRLPMTNSPLSPYLISGAGAYRSDCSVDPPCEATTRYGWNVGLGTKLFALGIRSFLEARYHRTGRGDADVHYFPVTLGVIF
jgi:hypothetical protein